MRCRLFFAVLAAMLLCGCSEREVNKAFIHPGRDFIAGCESAFCWSGGDEITLFDGSTLNSEYRYNGAPAENQGLFSLVGTASSGTFVKNASATWDESKIVPKGWTITTATN